MNNQELRETPAVTDVFKEAIAMADRREAFCKMMKPCPRCDTKQVQLVDWTITSEWKCRRCSHRWSGTDEAKA